MKRLMSFLLLGAILFGCQKEKISPNRENNEGVVICGFGECGTKNLNQNSLKIAEKIDGVIVCEIEEEDLDAALENYYNGQEASYPTIIEHTDGFVVMTGEVLKGKKRIKYAFELISIGNEFFLPIQGSEQHLNSKEDCQLNVYSVTEGECTCYGEKCNHFTTTSIKDKNPFGTAGLVCAIQEEQQN